uniref:Kinesin motor domain-containing protein n=1 Tax=Parastrongyloides trichosuri TaxID=131310 RepID=A0A0N4Z266_PARTI
MNAMATPFSKAKVIVCLKNKKNASINKCGRVRVLDNKMIEVAAPRIQPKIFGPFDGILDQDFTNERIFFEEIKPYVDGTFEGFKNFVISYGFSSSGKTNVLFGSDMNLSGGIVLEALKYAFEKGSNTSYCTTTMKLSIFELCGDRLFDLVVGDRRELSLNVDNENRLIIKELTALKIGSVEEAHHILKSAVDRRSVDLNSDFEITGRSHVFVKLETISKTENGLIKFGELMFGDLCTSSLMCNKEDKQFCMDVAATKNGYMFLNVLLENMLKRPDSSHSFRDSVLVYLLKPVVLGMYGVAMVFSLTVDHVSSDAISTLGIADKFRQLRCNPSVETEMSMRTGRRPGMILVSEEFVDDLDDIGYVVMDCDYDSIKHDYLGNIERNKKALAMSNHELRGLEIKLEQDRERDKLERERYEAALEENCRINERFLAAKKEKECLEVDLKKVISKKEDSLMEFYAQQKLHTELLEQHNELKFMCGKSLEASHDLDNTVRKLNGIMDQSMIKNEEARFKISSECDDLIGSIDKLHKALEVTVIENGSKIKELDGRWRNFKVELLELISEINSKISQRVDPGVIEEGVSRARESLELIVAGLRCAHEKCLHLFAESRSVVFDYDASVKEKKHVLVSSMNSILNGHGDENVKRMGANDLLFTEMENVENNMKGLMEILRNIDTIPVPEFDLSTLKIPSEGELQRTEASGICNVPRVEKFDVPVSVESLVLIEKMIFGEAYNLQAVNDENKEN